MRWAVGGEVAYEDRRNVYDYRDIFNGSHEADDVLGSGGTSASGERQRWSVNAKVSLPLRDDWHLELAGRHDDYGFPARSRAATSLTRPSRFAGPGTVAPDRPICIF